MTATAKIRKRSTMQDVRERERPSPQPDPEKFIRLPGLFRRWEIEEVLVSGLDFHIEAAGEASDGTPLYAAYWSEVTTPEISP